MIKPPLKSALSCEAFHQTFQYICLVFCRSLFWTFPALCSLYRVDSTAGEHTSYSFSILLLWQKETSFSVPSSYSNHRNNPLPKHKHTFQYENRFEERLKGKLGRLNSVKFTARTRPFQESTVRHSYWEPTSKRDRSILLAVCCLADGIRRLECVQLGMFSWQCSVRTSLAVLIGG